MKEPKRGCDGPRPVATVFAIPAVAAAYRFLGIAADPEGKAALYGGKEGEIGAPESRVRLYVIPTNEELLIARDTLRCVRDVPRRW